ncbi:MAG: ribonuclease HII [Propionibacteriaceae bacterium]|nr:ribonuclease HII [Propionibacteriaceae bacterium]
MTPDHYETLLGQAGLAPVAGVDEAGRGACAGPLVAAAVILDPARPIPGLDDSKALSATRRKALYEAIVEQALAVSWVRVEPAECDALGMHEADIQGMRRAVARLAVRPAFVLTDGFPVDGLGVPGLGVWKGDQVAACVSAASIVAKVTRDAIMVAYDADHPGYGLAGHKGYCTRAHLQALAELGPSDIHRLSYSCVADAAKVGGS